LAVEASLSSADAADELLQRESSAEGRLAMLERMLTLTHPAIAAEVPDFARALAAARSLVEPG
jgi:hypothetical protein